MGTLRSLACFAAAAIAAVCRAQSAAPQIPAAHTTQAPAPPSGFAAIETKFVEGKLSLVESGAGDLLVPTAPVLEPSDPGVKAELECRPAAGGVDLVVTFTNLTDDPRPLTGITLGLFTLSNGLRMYDMRTPFSPQDIDLNTYIPKPAVYPLEMYSPAVVFADSRLAVGVSVSYPLLAYRHDVAFTLFSPRDLKAAGKRGWTLSIGFSKGAKDKGPMRPGILAPRESRRYTVSVRAAPRTEWLRTLLPYREAFRALYGPVKYKRDGAPLAGFEVANAQSISEDNPAGWVTPFRPDQLGWTNVARFLGSDYDGWPTLLIANPSGLYSEQRQNNPPFQFATPWALNKSLQSATDPYNGFPSIVKHGKRVALRWGHAASVAHSWNPGSFDPFNPENQEHVRAGFAEADLAAKAGATTILLDSFTHTASPVWNLARWLETLRRRYPDIRFVASAVPCDVLHALVPVCVEASMGAQKPMRPGDPSPVTQPFAVADFLLPGHETWASVRCDSASTDKTSVEGEARRLAGLGYVPLIWCQSSADVSGVSAAPTWQSTVPHDLRIEAGPKDKDAEKARAEAEAPRKRGLEKITVRTGEASKPAQPESTSAEEQQRMITDALRRLRSTSAKANADAAKKPKIKVAPAQGDPKPADAEKKDDKK